MARAAGIVTALVVLVASGVAEAQDIVKVSGIVRGPDGAAVPDTEIRLYTEASMNSLQPASTCTTDSAGAYTCQAPPDTYWVAAVPPANSWLAFEFHPGGYPGQPEYEAVDLTTSRTDIDFSLLPGGRMTFDLLKTDGSPVDFNMSIHVHFGGSSPGIWYDDLGFDPSSGRYESSSLPAGEYFVALLPSDPGYLPQQYYCGVLAEDGATRVGIVAGQQGELSPCSLLSIEPEVISGRVTEKSGAPIEGVVMRALLDPMESTTEAMTDSDGRYSLEVLGGRWVIQAVPPVETSFFSEYYPGAFSWEDAEWVPGGSTDVDFVLDDVGGRVVFTLTADDGSAPGFRCRVAVIDFGEVSTPVIADSYANASGAYTSPVLPPGRYVFGLFPPPGSGYRQGQAFCDRYDWQGGERIDVSARTALDLGVCALIPDRFEPHTSSGSLFSYDHEWLLNHPNGEDFSTSAAAVSDLDGDELPDVVVSAITSISSMEGDQGFPANTVTVLKNEGGGRFTNAGGSWVPFEYFGAPRDIELADMDCDGRVDLVLGCHGVEWSDGTPWGEQDKIWRNVEGEYFTDMTAEWMTQDDPALYGLGDDLQAWFTHAIEVADIDADGDLDIARGTTEPVLLNDGTGTMFLAPPSTGTDGTISQEALRGAWGVDVGDLDRDGHLDMVWVSSFPDVRPGGAHMIYLGRGDGSFEPPPAARLLPAIDPDAVAYQPVVRDFNGDGMLDVFVANIDYGPLSVGTDWWDDPPYDQLFLNRGNDAQGFPLFEDATELLEQDSELNSSNHAVAGDVDSDGDLDIVTCSNTGGNELYDSPELRVLLAAADGRYDAMPRSFLPPIVASPAQILLFDADVDGDLDLYVGNIFPIPLLFLNRLLDTYDLDGDGYVTTTDAEEVRARLGTTDEGQAEDVNSDGVVDAKDLSLILRFQTTVRADNSTLTPACEPGGAR